MLCDFFFQQLFHVVCEERKKLSVRRTGLLNNQCCVLMRTSDYDVTESGRLYANIVPDLESLVIVAGREEEERSSGSNDDVVASSPTGRRSVAGVSDVGAGSPTIVRASVRPQSDVAETSRQVGVAARFVVSTHCPTQLSSSSESTLGQSDHPSRTSIVLLQQSSTSSSSSSSFRSCSSSSVSRCYLPPSLTTLIASFAVSSPSLVSYSNTSPSVSSATSQTSSSSSSSVSPTAAASVPDGYSRVASCLHPAHTSERDVQRLVSNCRQLNDSVFYAAELTSTDAKRRLHGCSPGRFLVRDSAHPRHLYSLSVKTQRGVTSIRTIYDRDGFRLDSEPDQVRCVLSDFFFGGGGKYQIITVTSAEFGFS